MDKFGLENWCEEVPEVVHNRLEQVVKGQVEGDNIIKMKKKTSYKKAVVISLVATMLLGTTVFADEIYNIVLKRDGYKTEIINEAETKETEEIGKIGETEAIEEVMEFAGYDYIQIKFGYLPEGFVAEREAEIAELKAMGVLDPMYEPDGITKFCNENGERISPTINKVDGESLIAEIKSTKEVLEFEFEGKKAYVISTYKVNEETSNKLCYIFFENSDYYVFMHISNGVSMEDVTKILENCSLVGTNEKWIKGEYVKEISTIVSARKEDEARYEGIEYKVEEPAKLFERFNGVGDTVDCGGNEITLNSFEYIDSIEEYDKSKFAFDCEAEWFDEEGRALDRHILIVKDGDGVQTIDEVIEEKDIPVKILRVNMTIKVNSQGDKDGTYVTPFLVWDGLEEQYHTEGTYETGRRKEEFVIYNELATNNKKGMTYGNLNVGDVVTYELLYIVDEADMGHIGLSFVTSPDSNEVVKSSFDIRIH